MPYRHLPALASRLLPPTAHAPSPGGWNVASFGVDEECESPIREIRQAVFFPQDLKEEEEGLLQDLRDWGIPVEKLFAAKGVTSEVNEQTCRGDVAEYVGAALIHDEGVRLERLWGKNFHKLKASHSEIGVDVVGVNLADTDGPLGEDELVVFVFAKHSLAKDLRTPLEDIVSEVRGLPIEALVQEIKFLREILITRGDLHAGRLVRFLEPLIQQGLGSEHARIRAVVLVDAARVGEVVAASSSLDRIEGFDRAVWVPGTDLALEELHKRVG